MVSSNMVSSSHNNSKSIQSDQATHGGGGGDTISVFSVPLSDLDARDEHDQEKAARIENEDLNREHKQQYKGVILIWLAWQSIGVVYGDIGTSPLYVFSSTFSSNPSKQDLIGALSIIFWSLTLIVAFKYVMIVLRADDDGQGGIFALYSLLARYANIVRVDPSAPDRIVVRLDRELHTSSLMPVGRIIRDFLERSRPAKLALKAVGILGVALVIADSVLTPAQSVLGAVQGIGVARPDLGRSAIVGISCAILVALFLVQPLGTSKIGTGFAPVVVIWLLFNGGVGIYNLIKYDGTVARGLSPHLAFDYLIRNRSDGWKSMGGLLLCFTGVEALFADLGAFGKEAIAMSFWLLTYPCLVLTYLGQAAYIASDETGIAYTNPFFYTIPGSTYYFGLVISVLAAVVASQAQITSTYQLISQVMRLSYFPHIKTVHTSKRFPDQIYLPFVNWLLMIGCVVVTAVYNNTTSLGHAYGTCVIIVAFLTTCLVSLVALVVWHTNVFLVAIFFLIFISLDGVYMCAALNKVPEGAWFALVLTAILSTFFILWRWGKEQQWKVETNDSMEPSELLLFPHSPAHNSSEDIEFEEYGRVPRWLNLQPAYGGDKISTAPGIGIIFDKVGTSGESLPRVFTQFVHKFKTRPQVTVFFHIRSLCLPTVPPSQRFVISRVTKALPSCYKIVLRHGYTDDVFTADLTRAILFNLMMYITGNINQGDENSIYENTYVLRPEVRKEIETLRDAEAAQTVYLMGKQVMRAKKQLGVRAYPRRLALAAFLWIRENSRTKLGNLDVDPDNLFEVSWVKEL